MSVRKCVRCGDTGGDLVRLRPSKRISCGGQLLVKTGPHFAHPSCMNAAPRAFQANYGWQE